TVAAEVAAALERFDLTDGHAAVALGVSWEGSASLARLDAFGRGVLAALEAHLEHGHPVVVVFDSDIGGLVGLHLRELAPTLSVVSIDGIDLHEFDYIDVGAILPASGVVPVVVKTLVFPHALPAGTTSHANPDPRGEPGQP